MEILCKQCEKKFEITQEDLAYYDKISPVFSGKKVSLDSPTLCPDCRKQRRLSYRNERKLYHRTCDFSGKPIISMFSPDKELKIYRQQDWWSDQNDASVFGRDFDFSRSFFDQFMELFAQVPHMNLVGENNENSDFCNLTANCKNCYLVFESSNNEDCLYSYWLQKCQDCTDVSFSHECRSSYQIDDCYNCEKLLYSQHCTNCSDSAFLFDCLSCRDCFMCVNLKQKQYCILNEQYTKEAYEEKMKGFNLGSTEFINKAKETFNAFRLQQPHRASQFVNVENCTGDYAHDSRNCMDCYHVHQAQDCKYAEHVWRNSKDNMDVSTVGRNAEFTYESINNGMDVYHNLFCIQCWTGVRDLIYCYSCFSCQDCFGCIGLKKKKYCILNKQYSKEEYEALVPRIIEHMEKTSEWGEFFPSELSPFAYNETVAQEYFPLSKEETLAKGLSWKEEDSTQNYIGPKNGVPDDIHSTEESICNKILSCEISGRPYKIIPQEFAFYQRMNLPIPKLSPDQRHLERAKARNPQRLWQRACFNCSKEIQTSYSPERLEKVFCEPCYLKTVY